MISIVLPRKPRKNEKSLFLQLHRPAPPSENLGNRKPYQGLTHTWAGGIHFTDFSAETLGFEYDAHQINLISARIYRITATAVEEDDENISDGPSGQGTP